MSTSVENLQRLTKAYHFAARKHTKQRRKKDKDSSPYINHPIDVVNILAEAGITNTNTLIAGALHDTIEDTKTSANELNDIFGPEVKNIVLECSDDKSLDKVTRKKLQILHAIHISDSAKLVKLADKFSNCSDLLRNKPPKWSEQEIKGYYFWSYAVYQNLKGVNKILDDKLELLFTEFGIYNIKQEHLNNILEEYYKCICNSD